MKKTLLLAASALMAFFAMNVGSASAHGANVYACIGAGENDGSFTPQQVNTGPIPGLGLAFGQELCVAVNPTHLVQSQNNTILRLGQAGAPSEPPTQEQLEELAMEIANIDYSNPLAGLILANTVCRGLGIQAHCNALVNAALGAPVPFGNVTLEGESGSCFSGVQSGTGTTSNFGGHSQSLEWTANYNHGANVLGIVKGSAEDRFGGGNEQNLNGVIGPGCGSGIKALVLSTHTP